MIGFSPGLLQGCFVLIDVVNSQPIPLEDICESFAKFGPVNSASVLEATQSLQWLRSGPSGLSEITEKGFYILSLSGYERRLRQAVFDFVDFARPAWLQNAAYGRDRVMSFVASEVRQVLIEAGVAGSPEPEIVDFWDALAARARGQRSEKLTEIGRVGERLTLKYEFERTGREPKWIAIEDNADGFDVLSIISSTDQRTLPIEVKASSIGINGTFHLSRNEWESSFHSDSYVFHLWDIKNPTSPALASLSASEIRHHVPNDLGDGRWELVEIPFACFRSEFVVQSV